MGSIVAAKAAARRGLRFAAATALLPLALGPAGHPTSHPWDLLRLFSILGGALLHDRSIFSTQT